MDLIYMDGSKRDIGVMHSYEMDMAFGDTENDFECKVPASFHCCQGGYGLYIEGTEYGGVIDAIQSDTLLQEVTYTGRTWHGILGSKIILPLQSGETSTGTVTLKATDTDGASMVNRYLTISGDAHACIQFILERTGLTDLFGTPATSAGVSISAYQFDRYTDAYKGIRKMLESAGLKLQLVYADGRVTLSAAPRYNYAQNEEFDSSTLAVRVKKSSHAVNHLICLGKGELEDRAVVHLYTDERGNVSTVQSIFGVDEYVDVYDYSAVESEEELLTSGTERLIELWSQDAISIDFDDVKTAYDVGDIVGAVENVTGITAAAAIVKKIVTIKNGKITIGLKTGECIDLTQNHAYSMTITDEGHLVCTFSATEIPAYSINRDGHLIYTYTGNPPDLYIDENGHLILKETE